MLPDYAGGTGCATNKDAEMLITVRELRKELEAYNQEMKISVLSHVHDGMNKFDIDRIEIIHGNDGPVGLALISYNKAKYRLTSP